MKELRSFPDDPDLVRMREPDARSPTRAKGNDITAVRRPEEHQ